jgi:hypothetical protein
VLTKIQEAGIDARMSDIGTAIQEVMESYEVEINGKMFPVKAVRNITGHDILRYHIHGGKQIPFIKNKSRDKMEEGEIFAIETFGTTGKGFLSDDVSSFAATKFLVSCAEYHQGWSLRLRKERQHIRIGFAFIICKVSSQDHRCQLWVLSLLSSLSRTSWHHKVSSWGKHFRTHLYLVLIVNSLISRCAI